MRSALERRVADTLAARAGDAGDVPGLADRVLAHGHRVRRRRRAVALTGASLAVALAAGTTVLLNHDEERRSQPPVSTRSVSPEPSPSLPPTPSPSPSPTPSPTALPSKVTDLLAQGAAPRITYALGPALVRGPGDLLPLRTEQQITGLSPVGSGVLLTIESAGRGAVGLFGPTQPYRELGSGNGRVAAVSADGRTTAWAVLAADHTQTTLWLVDLRTGRPIRRTNADGILEVVGFAGSRVVVNDMTKDPGGPARLWDPSTGTVEALGRSFYRAAESVSPDGELVSLVDGAECAVVVRVDQPDDELWRDCGYLGVGSFSPDGTRLLATDPGSRPVVVDARDGRVVRRLDLPGDTATGEATWEDDGSVLLQTAGRVGGSPDSAGGRSLLVRCRVDDGGCEVAGDPPPYDVVGTDPETSEPYRLVLPH